jgi:hypothetical protein
MASKKVRNDNIKPVRKCHCEFGILLDSGEAISRVEPQRTQSIIVFKKNKNAESTEKKIPDSLDKKKSG